MSEGLNLSSSSILLFIAASETRPKQSTHWSDFRSFNLKLGGFCWGWCRVGWGLVQVVQASQIGFSKPPFSESLVDDLRSLSCLTYRLTGIRCYSPKFSGSHSI